MYRKIILLLLCCLCMSTIYADTHKQRMIKYVNKAKYEKATKELPFVENWIFDAYDECNNIDIQKGYEFYRSLDTISVEKQTRDSLLLFLAKRCEASGYYYFNNQQYPSAVPFFEWSLGVKKSILGEKHPDYIETLGILSSTFRQYGDYEKAKEYNLTGLRIIEHNYGKHHPQYAYYLKKLGVLYYVMGEYVKSEDCYLQALEIYQDTSNTRGENYATLLYNLGRVYRDVEEYDKADYYYSLSLNVIKEIYGEKSSNYANSLTDISYLYTDMGDYSKANDALQTAWKIQTSLFDADNPIFIEIYSAWGNLNYESRYYSEAISYYSKALDLRKKYGDDINLSYAEALSLLGLAYHGNEQYEEANQYYQQAIKMRRKILKGSWPTDADLLNNMACLYEDYGEYEKAEEAFLSAIEIIQLYPNEKEKLRGYCQNLGMLYYNQGKYQKADQYLLPEILSAKEQYIHSLNYLSEKQRALFWGTLNYNFIRFIPNLAYFLYLGKPIMSCEAYSNELFFKGALLQSTEAIKRSIQESGDSMLIRGWNELSELKQTILHLQEIEPNSEDVKEYELKAEQLEKQITKASATYRENQAIWQITWDSVRNNLNNSQVSIEYMVAPLNEDSTMYCALLLRDTCSRPIMIPLFNEPVVASLINTNTDFRTNFTYSMNGRGDELSQLVWGKVLPYIKKGETIYFAPSGLLHQLAIESLPYDSTHTMSDVYNLVRLSSTREIVLNKSSDNHTTATLYGGIQYNMEAEELLAESESYSAKNLLASRSIESDTLNRGSVTYLAGTKKEVENINRMLQDNHLQVQLFTSTAANEESFKALSGTHQNILHVATHGFFWSDSTAQKKDFFAERMMRMGDDAPAKKVIDPLNRCGLLFAGANLALQGHSNELPEGVQDGILTAKEISLLDLRDADLVVLSACETGKGEITGDGVFGLQRAFKQAGVQTIIMSLWPVNDAATQMLMTEFYRNWIMDHQAKREAFRNAQNAVRGKYSEPAYWAGFVMLD